MQLCSFRIDRIAEAGKRRQLVWMKRYALLLIAFVAACSNEQEQGQSSKAQADPPTSVVKARIPLAGRVTDAADIIDPGTEAALTGQLAALEQATGHQMVVVTVTSLAGQDVADFTRDLGNAWGIGRRNHDDGVVVLIAPNERQVRIAVARGLEKALPDALCKAIIDAQMLPHFRAGQLQRGIEAGVSVLIQTLMKTTRTRP
nr:TPM domain-containing protein [Sphingomonas sp. SFZ2018-12]